MPRISDQQEFSDADWRAVATGDQSKKIKFDLSGLTTATTRTLTPQDASGTIYISGGTDVPVADGGTGVSTLAANAVVVGAGTSPVTTIAPGTSGNVLTSNGTVWASSAPAASGQPVPASSAFAVGTLLIGGKDNSGTTADGANFSAGHFLTVAGSVLNPTATGRALSGTWMNVSGYTVRAGDVTDQIAYGVRTA